MAIAGCVKGLTIPVNGVSKSPPPNKGNTESMESQEPAVVEEVSDSVFESLQNGANNGNNSDANKIVTDTEYFCTYDKFPWFKGAKAEDMFKVEGDIEHTRWDEWGERVKIMTRDFLKVTSVTSDGFWIVINVTEYFCPFEKFPWFRNATSADIFKVQGQAYHLWWDELDIDLKEDDFKELATIIRPVTNNGDSK